MELGMINLFGAVIEYFALYAFLWMFFEVDERKKKWGYIGHIVIPILFFLFSTYIDNIFLRPVLFVICSWFIAWEFRGDAISRIFSVSVFQIILVLIEINISFSLYQIEELLQTNFYLACNIFMKTITLIILIVLFLISTKRKIIFSHLKPIYVIVLILFSAVSLFLISFLEFLLLRLDNSELYLVGCWAIFLCVSVNIALYYLFYQLAVGESAKEQLKFINFHLSHQKEEQTYIDHTFREVRKLAHDMDRYLSVIYLLLEQGKVEDAMEELERRKLEITRNLLFDTGYPILNSVLTYKFQIAQEKNIHPQLFWNLKEEIQVNLTDLAVILSNSLDNAIEAAAQVKKEDAFVSVTTETKENFIKIVVSNPTAITPKIENGTIATTKRDKGLHGLGLESIRTLAQRYGGTATILCENYIFTLIVVLKNTAIENIKDI